MILSAKLLEFNIRFQILVPYVNDEYERLNLTSDFVELLNEFWETWEAEFKNYIDPMKHQHCDIQVRYAEAFDFLAKLRTRLKGDSFVKLNGNDKEYLEVNTNTKSVGKIPVPDFAPSLACIFQTHLVAKFYAFDPKFPQKKKKPRGGNAFGVKLAFTEEGAPAPKPDDYRRTNPEKKSIFEIYYPEDKARKVMYIIVYYISPTGEEGKESNPLVVNLI